MTPSLLASLAKSPAALDQYRLLRTRLVQSDPPPQVISITSACPGDGKSLTAVNLAWSLAMRPDARVALVDADLRRPTLHRSLGIEPKLGLVDVLEGASLSDALVAAPESPGLQVLPAGVPPANPTELLDSEAWRSTVAALREQFEFVIVDGPPLGGVADYNLIEAVADGVLMVMRPGHTARLAFHAALSDISRAKFLGVLVNDFQDWMFWKSRGYRYYQAPN